MKLKIQALGNGTGRPVNVHAVWDEQLNEMRPTSGRKQQFFKDNPALPLYLNGEPYMGFDVVEGGRVWQSRMKSQLSWETHDTDVKSISHGSLIETREIYRITPSAPDNDKKVAEARDGNNQFDKNRFYTKQLHDCPFCGGKAGEDLFMYRAEPDHYLVKCSFCTASMKHDRADKVIGIWNHRGLIINRS